MKSKLFLPVILGLAAASCASLRPSCSDSLPPPSMSVGPTSGDGGTYSLTIPPDQEDPYVDGPQYAGSSSGTVPPPPPPPPPLDSGLTHGDTWQISVPPQFKNKTATKKSIVLSKVSEQDKVLLVLLIEPYHGSYDDYTLGSVRSFKEDGVSVTSSKSIEMNGSKFLSLEVMQENIKILNLISYKSGNGYILSCGGLQPYDKVVKLCTSIFEQFIIK